MVNKRNNFILKLLAGLAVSLAGMSHPVVNKTDPTGYKYSFFGQAYATNKNKNDMRMPRRKNEKFPEEDIGKFTEEDGSSRKALNSDSSKKETNKGPEVYINSFKKNIRSKYKESNKKGKKSEIEEDQKIEDEKIEDKKINDQNNQNIENIKSGTGTTTIKNKINDGDSYNRGLIPMPTSEREKINNEIKKSLFEGPHEKKISGNENNSNNEKSLNKQMEELKSYKTDAKKHGEVPFTGVENLDDIANGIKIFKSEQKNTNKKLLKSNSIGSKKKGKHNAPLSERKMTLPELIKNTESAQEIPIGDFLDNKRGLSENNKLSQSYAGEPYTYMDERGIVNIDIKMSKLSHKNTKKIQNNKNTKEIQNSKSYNIIDELRQIKRRHSEKIETTKTKTTQVTPYHRKKVFAKPGFNFASQSGEHNEFNKYYSFSEIKGGNNKLINMGLIVEEAEEDDKENISDAYKYNTQPYNTQTYTQSARPYVRKINSKLFTKNTYGNAKLDYNVNIPNKNTNILGSKGNIFLDSNEDDDKNRIFTEVPTNVEGRNTEGVSTSFLPQSKSRSRNNIENKKDDIENEMDINNIKIEKEIASNNNIFSSFSNNNAPKKLELTNEPENNKDEANNNLNNISMSEINNNNAENLNNDSGFFSENKSEIKNIEIKEEIKNKNMLTNMLTNNPEEKVNNNKEENNDKPKDSMVNPYKNNNNNEGEANNNLNNMNILNINAPKIDNLFTAQNSFTDVVKNKRKGERSNIDNLLDSIDNDSKKDMNAGENTNNIINEKLNTQNPLNTNPLLEMASLIKNLNNQNNDSKNNIKIEEEKEIKEEKKDEIKEEIIINNNNNNLFSENKNIENKEEENLYDNREREETINPDIKKEDIKYNMEENNPFLNDEEINNINNNNINNNINNNNNIFSFNENLNENKKQPIININSIGPLPEADPSADILNNNVNNKDNASVKNSLNNKSIPEINNEENLDNKNNNEDDIKIESKKIDKEDEKINSDTFAEKKDEIKVKSEEIKQEDSNIKEENNNNNINPNPSLFADVNNKNNINIENEKNNFPNPNPLNSINDDNETENKEIENNNMNSEDKINNSSENDKENNIENLDNKNNDSKDNISMKESEKKSMKESEKKEETNNINNINSNEEEVIFNNEDEKLINKELINKKINEIIDSDNEQFAENNKKSKNNIGGTNNEKEEEEEIEGEEDKKENKSSLFGSSNNKDKVDTKEDLISKSGININDSQKQIKYNNNMISSNLFDSQNFNENNNNNIDSTKYKRKQISSSDNNSEEESEKEEEKLEEDGDSLLTGYNNNINIINNIKSKGDSKNNKKSPGLFSRCFGKCKRLSGIGNKNKDMFDDIDDNYIIGNDEVPDDNFIYTNNPLFEEKIKSLKLMSSYNENENDNINNNNDIINNNIISENNNINNNIDNINNINSNSDIIPLLDSKDPNYYNNNIDININNKNKNMISNSLLSESQNLNGNNIPYGDSKPINYDNENNNIKSKFTLEDFWKDYPFKDDSKDNKKSPGILGRCFGRCKKKNNKNMINNVGNDFKNSKFRKNKFKKFNKNFGNLKYDKNNKGMEEKFNDDYPYDYIYPKRDNNINKNIINNNVIDNNYNNIDRSYIKINGHSISDIRYRIERGENNLYLTTNGEDEYDSYQGGEDSTYRRGINTELNFQTKLTLNTLHTYNQLTRPGITVAKLNLILINMGIGVYRTSIEPLIDSSIGALYMGFKTGHFTENEPTYEDFKDAPVITTIHAGAYYTSKIISYVHDSLVTIKNNIKNAFDLSSNVENKPCIFNKMSELEKAELNERINETLEDETEVFYNTYNEGINFNSTYDGDINFNTYYFDRGSTSTSPNITEYTFKGFYELFKSISDSISDKFWSTLGYGNNDSDDESNNDTNDNDTDTDTNNPDTKPSFNTGNPVGGNVVTDVKGNIIVPSNRFKVIVDEHINNDIFNTVRDEYNSGKDKGLWFSISNDTLRNSSKGIDGNINGSNSTIANVGYNNYDMKSSFVLSFAKSNIEVKDSKDYKYNNVILSHYGNFNPLSNRGDIKLNTLLSYVHDSKGKNRLSLTLSGVKITPLTLGNFSSKPLALDTEFRIGFNTGVAKGIKNMITLSPIVRLSTINGLVFNNSSVLNANVFVKYDHHMVENKSKFKISDALNYGLGVGYSLNKNLSLNLASIISNNGIFGIDLGVGLGW